MDTCRLVAVTCIALGLVTLSGCEKEEVNGVYSVRRNVKAGDILKESDVMVSRLMVDLIEDGPPGTLPIQRFVREDELADWIGATFIVDVDFGRPLLKSDLDRSAVNP